MANIFDDIYKKKLNLNFRNLSSGDKEFSKEENFLKPDLLGDDELNILFSSLYNSLKVDDIPNFNKNEINIIDEKIKRNRVETEKLRRELSVLKDDLIESVKNEAYSLNIEKSTFLKKTANNIFGGNKKEITYEDYIQLMEMKQKIIELETTDILDED
jgi:hypothetical protein